MTDPALKPVAHKRPALYSIYAVPQSMAEQMSCGSYTQFGTLPGAPSARISRESYERFYSTFLVLGLLGGWTQYRRDPKGFAYFGPLMFLMTLALIYYLNFRYGASQAPTLDVPREVRDRDYFYLWSFSAWGVWASLGLMRAWESIAVLIPGGRTGAPSRVAWLAGAPVAAIALVPLAANWSPDSRREDVTTIAFARDLLNVVVHRGCVDCGQSHAGSGDGSVPCGLSAV